MCLVFRVWNVGQGTTVPANFIVQLNLRLTFPTYYTRYRLHTMFKCVYIAQVHSDSRMGECIEIDPETIGLEDCLVSCSTIKRLLQPKNGDSQNASSLTSYDMSCCARSSSRKTSSVPRITRYSRRVGISRWKVTEARAGLTKYIVLPFSLPESCLFSAAVGNRCPIMNGAAVGLQDDRHRVTKILCEADWRR